MVNSFLPFAILALCSGEHFAQDNSELTFFAFFEIETKSTMSESVVTDDGDISLVPVDWDTVIFVDFDEGFEI